VFSRNLLLSLGLSFLLSACGTTNSAPPSFSSSLALVSTKISKTADIIGEARSNKQTSRTGLDSVWTDDAIMALSNTGTETLQAWIGHMFDPSFTNSNDAKVTFAGRISNSTSILCFIANGSIPSDDTGLPAAGTHSVTITEAIATTCGLSRGRDVVGQTISLTVETPTDTSIYSKSMSAVMPGQEACPFKFLAKVTADDVNIVTSEDQNCDSRNQASAAIFRYNATTQISRFTYVSQNFDSGSQGFEFYRGLLNEATDEAHVLGIYGGQTDGTLSNYVSFTATGKPTAGGTTALSVKLLGQSVADGIYNGCIGATSNAVVTDDSLACTVTGTDISSAFSVITSSKAANTEIASIYNIGATSDLRFTSASNIYTY